MSKGTALLTCRLETRWRWVVNFTLRQLFLAVEYQRPTK